MTKTKKEKREKQKQRENLALLREWERDQRRRNAQRRAKYREQKAEKEKLQRAAAAMTEEQFHLLIVKQAEEKEAARKKAVKHAQKVIDTARRKEYKEAVMAPAGVHWVAPKPKPVRVKEKVVAAIKLPCPRPAGWVVAPPQKGQVGGG